MSVQGQPAVIVEATTQMPKAIIPAEINKESAVSMVTPFLQSANRAAPFRGARGVGPPAEVKGPAAPIAQTEWALGPLGRTTKTNRR